jgi:hypothetical protein
MNLSRTRKGFSSNTYSSSHCSEVRSQKFRRVDGKKRFTSPVVRRTRGESVLAICEILAWNSGFRAERFASILIDF